MPVGLNQCPGETACRPSYASQRGILPYAPAEKRRVTNTSWSIFLFSIRFRILSVVPASPKSNIFLTSFSAILSRNSSWLNPGSWQDTTGLAIPSLPHFLIKLLAARRASFAVSA
jgi:hypothetical protein